MCDPCWLRLAASDLTTTLDASKQATFGCVWMRQQGGGMVHGGGQGGGCWRYSTLYRLRKGKDNRVRKDARRADGVESRMAREVGKMERLAMENIGCGWRGSVYGEHGCLSLDGCHSANYCTGWLIFNVHPRLHPTRLHPTPHAPFEFAFVTSDSTLDTRLSLNARRICSATPQHPTHHTQLVHSHSATSPRWLNYATDEREDMQDRWQSTRWERVGQVGEYTAEEGGIW
ncbi:hypothetical protein CNAG_07791 [Cryptococcus neoformans var. grubii H99]|nr:hypothetical protein CNAG_07791 [Cryptococcus neoformans var. grubii H99]AFR97283.2 hypothetical protein CNAG_07791 [Cryptococcus neoformans var. grubii H99]AUB27282.1 hypothetical protein CKF44_07791 [Cryptococcus neoformans var. grubii]|eukprot:XP_012051585.1 hypothetical protein CNAG_07791 [Cryptococcus neoformans var. grubii H99]